MTVARRVPTDSIQCLKLTAPRSATHLSLLPQARDNHWRAIWLILGGIYVPKAVTKTRAQEGVDLDISQGDANSRKPVKI